MKTIFALLFLASPVFAQVRESVTVEVVEVPVYVTAADGTPIRGLTRDAFELRVGRQPQPIEYFDAIDFSARPREQTAALAPRPQHERRLYLLLFDLNYSDARRIARAQRAARKVVAASNPATDLFAVATFTSASGVHFVSSFVSDRPAIDRALVTLQQSELHDPLGISMSLREHATWLTTTTIDAEGELPETGSGEMNEALVGGFANQEASREPAKRLIEYQLSGLAAAATRLSGLEGQKHVLFFSQGFDSTTITDIKRQWEPPRYDARLLGFVDQMREVFASAGVMLDTVDIAGMRHPFTPGNPGTFTDLTNDSLYLMARATGGRVVANTNDLAAGVRDLTAAQQVVYVLGFHPRVGRGAIKVRVKGVPASTRVTYRDGFGYARPPRELDPLQLADILLNDTPQSGFEVNVKVSPRAGGADVTVAIPRSEVIPQLPPKTPWIDVLLYVFDPQGATAGFAAKQMSFEPRARQVEGFATLQQPFDLPPGAYAVKVVAFVGGTSIAGFTRSDFEVAAAAGR